MADMKFQYTEVLKSDRSGKPVNVIAHLAAPDRPLRAVIWSFLHRAWIFAPGTAADLLYDDHNFDRLRPIDRTTAEQSSRETLHVELPSEDVLAAMSVEGEANGWSYGPPRSSS